MDASGTVAAAMLPGARPPAPPARRPAWYRRLPPGLQRVAAASDRVPVVPLRANEALRGAVAALPGVLATGRAGDVEALAQHVSDGICGALRVPHVRVRVQLRRPPCAVESCRASTSPATAVRAT